MATVAELQAKLNIIESRRREDDLQLERIRTQLQELERFPERDPFEEGAVIKFKKRFTGFQDRSGRQYDYTALKCGDQWYTSGPRKPGPYTWPELVSFLSTGVDHVYEGTEWVEVLTSR